MDNQLIWHPLAVKDYKSLDGSQKKQIDKALIKILKLGGNAGEALQGNLQGYRKLKQKRLGLRLVFKVNNLTGEVYIITVIAIGKRESGKVYEEALRRIHLHNKKS
ncbi:type II toxin-antitoxin system RelE family toxin [Enterococcus sp. AZ109]|uniref:type II toxin-antitoxin system RelE family toxin n=1 Tax=Enterococcus sp. AZ109 TaxID=2774634 RepID=UPI003F24CCCE